MGSSWVMRTIEYEPGLKYEEHILKLEEPLLLRVLQVDDPKRPDHYEGSLYAVMPEADWAEDFPEGMHEEAILREFSTEGPEDAKRRIINLTRMLLNKSSEMLSYAPFQTGSKEYNEVLKTE